MRAIDADEVFKAAYDMACQCVLIPGCEDYAHGLREAANYIENAPTLDVAPVRHSYWEEYSCSQYMGMDEEGEPKYRDGRVLVCHNLCCRRKTVVKSNYCPNCGAKMDAGQEDDSHGENTDG